MSWKNFSLKRGNEKVAISNINTIISNDIQKVWNIVLAVDKYNSWRSDLSKTEIINDKQFIEYTKNGYAVAAGLFCRKMDGRFCRKKPDTDVRRAGRIDVAGVFCRTREGRGQSRSLH